MKTNVECISRLLKEEKERRCLNETDWRNLSEMASNIAHISFGNIVAGECDDEYKRKRTIWTLFGYETIKKLLEFDDTNVFTLTTMIIYNCLVENVMRKECLNNEIYILLNILLQNIARDECASEWSLLTLETFLKCENVLNFGYYRLQTKSRLVLLDVIYEMVKKISSSQMHEHLISQSNLITIANLLSFNITDVFKLSSTKETTTTMASESLSPLEVSKMLTILCEVTSNSDHAKQFQQKSLVENLLDTLKALHLLAKSDSPESVFKSIATLREKNSTKEEELELSPTYGFKRNIIRLITNLSYQCLDVQNWVREMDGIPLILDVCRLDASNPYIMQWCIFAVRNLLENNRENQSIVASISRDGTLIDSPLLRELGLQIVDGKITTYTKQ
ncbi:ataxin-10-like protein [Dinothrombium tinctorium]|uniref:Ataxin-10 n=1 Tax=Dinothrombium tinctorium TaxID=1965070 RepID=A0A3S3PJR6_9ACAR|nr:ataxin-10-like protein [Dinothrombium tinctorium]